MSKVPKERAINQVSAHEIATHVKLECEKIVRGVVTQIGFDPYDVDSSSVDSKELGDKTGEVLVGIDKLDPDLAGGVHIGNEDREVVASDQGVMFGYVTDETEDCMSLTHSVTQSQVRRGRFALPEQYQKLFVRYPA